MWPFRSRIRHCSCCRSALDRDEGAVCDICVAAEARRAATEAAQLAEAARDARQREWAARVARRAEQDRAAREYWMKLEQQGREAIERDENDLRRRQTPTQQHALRP